MAKQPVKFSGPNITTLDIKSSKDAPGHIVSDTKKKMGAPSTYTEELATEFCRMIAEGRSTRWVCEQDGMPDITTIYDWKRRNADFARQYALAMEDRGASYGDRLSDLVEEVLAGEYEVDRARLAIDTLKWTAARLAPKQYGDKQQVDVRVDLGKTAATVLMELSNKANEKNLIDVTPTEATP